MADMTQKERAMLYNMFADISSEFSSLHYTFEFNKDTIELDLIQKISPTCNTRHCLTKQELYTWYLEELTNIKNGKETYALAAMKGYAEYYGMDYNTYMAMINITINNAVDNNPEYFI